MSLQERHELGMMQKLAAFAGQMTASSDCHRINWGYLPRDTGNRVIYALADMPVVRIQITSEVPNRDAYYEFKKTLRQKWGVYATIEVSRLSWDMRGESTTPGDMRVTVVKSGDPRLTELRQIAQACKTGQFTLHLADSSDAAVEVIGQIKVVVRSWLMSRCS